MLILMLVAIYGIIATQQSRRGFAPASLAGIALILLPTCSHSAHQRAGWPCGPGCGFVYRGHLCADVRVTFGGVVTFFLGALMLFDRADPGSASRWHTLFPRHC